MRLNFLTFNVNLSFNKEISIEPWLKQFLTEKELKNEIRVRIAFRRGENRILKIKKNSYLCFADRREWELILFLIRNILYEHYFDFNFFILHANALILNKKVLVFCGQTGSGKTTIANTLNNGKNIINDDTIIIHKVNDHYLVSSYPFTTNKKLMNNIFGELSKFFLVNPSRYNNLREATREEAESRILNNLFPLQDKIKFKSIVKEFCKNKKIYILQHNVWDLKNFLRVISSQSSKQTLFC